jgi:hypothetical protein
MKNQRVLVALTVVNLGLLVFLLAQIRLPEAHSVEPVLRGRALEIVDEQGRVRASIKVLPAGSANGISYPATVILRLVDPKGRPPVKLVASEQGAGLLLMGDSDSTYVRLDGATSSLKLTNKDGREQLIKP